MPLSVLTLNSKCTVCLAFVRSDHTDRANSTAYFFWPIVNWVCGFESHSEHGFMSSFFLCVHYHVESEALQ